MQTAPSAALVLHGRLGSWKRSASELKPDMTATGRRDREHALSERRSFAHFTHDSLWRHFVLANRMRGVDVRVAIHLWEPELADTFKHLFRPDASQFEAALPQLSKVESQHLSLKRALALLSALSAPPVEHVFVTRPDLLLFDDLLLSLPPPAGISPRSRNASAGVLWLPHHCVPLRLRLSSALNRAHSRAMSAACSGSDRPGAPQGERVQPPQFSRISPPSIRDISHADDFALYVLDHFFVASLEVAHSFAAIYNRFKEYSSAIRARFGGRRFPVWSHLFWAQHITVVLAARGVRVRFLQHVETTLARFWRYGFACRVRSTAGLPRREDRIAVDAVSALVRADIGPDPFPRSVGFGGGGGGGGGIVGEPARWMLSSQCPHALWRAHDAAVRCPWYAAACGQRWHERTLRMGATAGSFQAQSGLPPRQLLGAERCRSAVCMAHNGTARRQVRARDREGLARATPWEVSLSGEPIGVRGNPLQSMAVPPSMVSGIGAIAGTEGSPPCLHYTVVYRPAPAPPCAPHFAAALAHP